MASALDKAGFPILTTEEAVANCKSMFGVALSVEDLLRPQVKCLHVELQSEEYLIKLTLVELLHGLRRTN